MKDIEVLNRLEGDAAIIAIIGTRIWTTWLPEKTTYPAITCNYTSESPTVTLTEDTLKGRQIIAVNIWAKNKQGAIDLLVLVKARMSGFAVRRSTAELNEEEQGIYRYSVDYSVF